ncbi:MAG: radical SAM protein [Fusobacteriaceae bacterium]
MKFISAKSILSPYTEESPWFGGNYNMNLYKGCSHGCIYCDSRSECYQIENFDEVRAKENSIKILEQELKTKRKKGVIGMGAMSDPYNPLEENYKLTRSALELIDKYKFGIGITTKSSLVTRDIDILKRISSHSPVLIQLTVTSANDLLCKKIETNVSPSSERFSAIKKLSDAGIFCGILLMPVLPFIEDSPNNVLNIIKLAKINGAKYIYARFGVTLRLNQRDWFYKKLDENFPGIKEKYIAKYGTAYECTSPYAGELFKMFQDECKKSGILYRMPDIISKYKENYSLKPQLSLF